MPGRPGSAPRGFRTGLWRRSSSGPRRPGRVRVPRTVRPCPLIEVGHADAEFGTAGGGPVVVVAGPREVAAEGVGRLPGGGGGEQASQFGQAFGGVPLLAEHHVEPVPEGGPAAGPGVVGGERGGVQGAGPVLLGGGGPGPVLGGEVLEERLHHVPGRDIPPVQAGPHTVGVAPPEHRAPSAARIQPGQQAVQVVRELPHLYRELIHSHRPLPATPEHSGP
ncbi:hypothetical protein [Streptomyces glaucescens]|uniref:hypothetical protein n=1 Tax=Streptomyces glaucescens TaxID=1907 RepID=UPI0013025FB4